MPENKDGLWEIQNQLLSDLLTYGDGGQRVTGLNACWSIGCGFPIVKGIVTWLAMRALRIERLPWMADWPFTHLHTHANGLEKAINYMQTHPEEVQAACDEICSIYNHTQSFYAESFLVLGRGYKNDINSSGRFGDYATTVKRHALAAQLLGQQEISIPHDVITSWGRHWSYAGCVVGVQADIPKSQILCSSETLSPRRGGIGKHAPEAGEFLVLTQSWDGIRKFPVESVVSDRNFNVKVPSDSKEAQDILSRGIPTMRQSVNFRDRDADSFACPQAFNARLRRAWDILWANHQ